MQIFCMWRHDMFSSNTYLKLLDFLKHVLDKKKSVSDFLYDILWKFFSTKESTIETLKIYIGHTNCSFCLIVTKIEFDRQTGTNS